MDDTLWGPAFGAADIAKLLAERQRQISTARVPCRKDIGRKVLCQLAKAIADGKVVGWFQGQMEWGPRALGNRSILCGPRHADMKALLNAKGITPSVRAFGAELRIRMDVLVISDTISLRQNER
jgi:carbamoyltransferase